MKKLNALVDGGLAQLLKFKEATAEALATGHDVAVDEFRNIVGSALSAIGAQIAAAAPRIPGTGAGMLN